METRIKGVYLSKKGPSIIDIYGYSSKGLPGIDLIGIGRKGQNIREKFIYISKCRKLSIPLKRYALCIEDNCSIKLKDEDGIGWLELPLLLLFWCLAGVVSINNLERCFAAGKVMVDGKIVILRMNNSLLELLMNNNNNSSSSSDSENNSWNLFSIENNKNAEEFKIYGLPLDEILETIPDLYFETSDN
ncbi:MAG: hypothetical protein HQK49_02100 [Oligoflexia bacterium]|nr:hypothetical protein [Oligoflexia bacterium]